MENIKDTSQNFADSGGEFRPAPHFEAEISLTIPEGVEELTADDLKQYKRHMGIDAAVTAVILPRSLRRLGHGALQGTSIERVTIPRNVEYIGVAALGFCSRLKHIEVEEGNHWFKVENGLLLTSSGTRVVQAPGAVTGMVRVPDGVKTIGEYAFAQCENMTQVLFPEGLDTIERSAFQQCTGLERLELPHSLTTMEKFCFGLCFNVKTIRLPENLTAIPHGAFMGCHVPEMYLPSAVEEVEELAFTGEYPQKARFDGQTLRLGREALGNGACTLEAPCLRKLQLRELTLQLAGQAGEEAVSLPPGGEGEHLQTVKGEMGA